MEKRKDDMVHGERNTANTGKGWDGGTPENQNSENQSSSAIPPGGTTQTSSSIPPNGGNAGTDVASERLEGE